MNRIEMQLNLVPVQRKGTVNMDDAQPAAEITAAPEPAPENEDPVIEITTYTVSHFAKALVLD